MNKQCFCVSFYFSGHLIRLGRKVRPKIAAIKLYNSSRCMCTTIVIIFHNRESWLLKISAVINSQFIIVKYLNGLQCIK